MKTKKKNQKPIEINAYFKYRCEDSSCGYDHWISLIEAKTKDFKIVCDCGSVIRPKRIKNISIEYRSKKRPPKSKIQSQNNASIIEYCNVLCGYGFSMEEASKLIEIAYKKLPNGSKREIIKLALTSTGELE
jgi:hypothetical protein